jgi:glycosyltransferase involved in cell wall biosynthesis
MGGAEYRCKLVLDELCRQNTFDIYYLCRNIDSNFVPRGYQIQKVGTRLGNFGLYLDSFNLYRALKQIKPHTIYQNGGSSYTGIAVFYAKRYGAKLIHQICNDNSLRSYSGPRLKTRIKSALEKILLDYGMQHADVIVGQSRRQNDLLQNRYARKCDMVISLGHPLPINKIDKSANIVVLWISNFKYHQKQPHLFVELAKRFRDKKDVSFVMIGGSIGREDEFRNFLEKVNTVPNLSYLGQVSQDEVNLHLRKGHILINTSRFEGFPNTFVQAWLREVPVISLNVDPDNILIREKIGFCSKSFEKLVNDVTTLVENKVLREEMGKRAHQYAETNHTIDKMVEKLVKLF